ncbi:BON domain-containing protein [Pyxidicoccus sp. 3LG]
MANRRYEEVPEDWNDGGPRGNAWRGSTGQPPDDTRSGARPGGGYGLGGASRGYNQGGWGPSSYEEGYTHRGYDRLLELSERSREDTEAPRYTRGELPHSVLERERERPRALGRAPRGYVRSDERLREDVCERLIDSPFDASDVDVQVKDAEVTLSGTVKSRQERRDIEDLVVAVRGVHDVFNRIRVAEGGQERKLHS